MASQEDIQAMAQDYNNLQQQLQMVLMQRQQLSIQEKELEQALNEIESSEGPFYRFVGSVLIARNKAKLKEELTNEKQDLSSKNELFEKQEKKLMNKFNDVRTQLEAYAKTQKQGSRQQGAN